MLQWPNVMMLLTVMLTLMDDNAFWLTSTVMIKIYNFRRQLQKLLAADYELLTVCFPSFLCHILFSFSCCFGCYLCSLMIVIMTWSCCWHFAALSTHSCFCGLVNSCEIAAGSCKCVYVRECVCSLMATNAVF